MPPSRATERRFSAAAAILMAAILPVAGCATLAAQPGVKTRAEAENIKQQADELAAALDSRSRSLVSMRTSAVMEYTTGDRHLKAREDIVAERPDRLRVDARSPFGVALILASHEGEVAIYEPDRNRFMRGAASAATLDRYVQIPMAPADAVNLLMGLTPPGFALGNPADRVSEDGTMLVAAYGRPGSELHQLGFTGGNLAMVRDTAPDGKVRYEVRYGEYRDIGGLMFPYTVDADFPPAQSHVTFRYTRPIVNGDVPLSTFVLTPAPGAPVINLSAESAGPLDLRG